MRKDTGHVFRIEDYRPSDYRIARTRLTFILDERYTLVTAELDIERRAETPAGTPLTLDGDELELVSLAINAEPASADLFKVSPQQLVLTQPPHETTFCLTIITRLDPSNNGTLMGLYRSSNVWCTQCEPEGFRRITYFLDRPDILSIYTVRIEADRQQAPLLLSNGNPVESGPLANGRHYAVWHDPFPKPSYLFALVAGDLAILQDTFTTASGRKVALAIHVEHGKQTRAVFAMDALKRSMRWDEAVFGLEYDLDIFNIVAVSDFNMGAMENKGLNIFNDKYILADEATATDTDFANIEAIIAHEYFHNWTGNRITCRDWFQLCLKEGLTVFRDHEFSADQRSRPVRRITEIRTLRAYQFPEDQGPLAHPVRPRRYREINNFYTATVYEKGSEVVRMIRTILGAPAFHAGLKLYLDRHDGESATIEDFIHAFEDASGQDLTQFSLWYHQAGTPNLAIAATYDALAKEFTLDIEQSTPPTPSESRKRLMHIPLAFGLVGPDGQDIQPENVEGATVENGVIHVRKRKHSVRFRGVETRPVLSLNRGFSAPITLTVRQGLQDLLCLARKDSDLVARWQALETLSGNALVHNYHLVRSGEPVQIDAALLQVIGDIASDEALEPAWRALALTLPAENDIAREIGFDIDPDAIFTVRQAMIDAIAAHNGDIFDGLYHRLQVDGPFLSDPAEAGRRALRNVLLNYLSASRSGPDLAASQFATATNMTDMAASLTVLAHRFSGHPATIAALLAFEQKHRDDPLTMDKWYQIQATVPGNEAVDLVEKLTGHQGFSLVNPNRVRALIGTFSTLNQTGFHRADGAGYNFFVRTILDIEKRNPQLAARLATAMRSWRSLEPKRQAAAHSALLSLAAPKVLSRDLRDIIERTLA